MLERRGRRRQTAIQRSTLWRSDQGERKSAKHPQNGSAKATSEVRAARHSALSICHIFSQTLSIRIRSMRYVSIYKEKLWCKKWIVAICTL